MTLQASTKAICLDIKATDINDLCLDSLNQLDIDWQFQDKTNATEVAALIKGKAVVVTNKVVLDRQLIENASDLKLICISATGTNNVDLQAAREKGIDVCNVTAYATSSVVQYVFTVLLTLMSRLPEHQQAVVNGEWSKSEAFCLLDYPFHELAGKTLGIVGYGELGQAVANIAKSFGMTVLLASRNDADTRDNRIPLNDLLALVDVLSLHCPLTQETKNLISLEQIMRLPKGAILINSARGGVVDEKALLSAIQNGHLGGAATDVLTTEPPPKEHLLLQNKYPNLIVTPHIAWASIESRQRLIDQVAFNISEYFLGRPRNIVN